MSTWDFFEVDEWEHYFIYAHLRLSSIIHSTSVASSFEVKSRSVENERPPTLYERPSSLHERLPTLYERPCYTNVAQVCMYTVKVDIFQLMYSAQRLQRLLCFLRANLSFPVDANSKFIKYDIHQPMFGHSFFVLFDKFTYGQPNSSKVF